MNIESNLILAKQQACSAKGLNFYVTKSGIKRDYDLFNGSYIYKVYFKNGIHVEDSKGEKVETQKQKRDSEKATIPSKLRNSKDEKASKNDESKRSELSTD